MPAKLKKAAILRGKGSFTALFTTGRSYTAGAIRCFYNILENKPKSVRAGFTVTRNVQNAAIRNRMKRLMKESWRRQQHRVHNDKRGLEIAFHYHKTTEKKNLRQDFVDAMMQELVEKLTNAVSTGKAAGAR